MSTFDDKNVINTYMAFMRQKKGGPQPLWGNPPHPAPSGGGYLTRVIELTREKSWILFLLAKKSTEVAM